MTTNRQLLVALGLAGAVLLIGFRESAIADRELPSFITAARARSGPVAPAADDGDSEEPGFGFDFSREPAGLEDELGRLPIAEVFSVLSGGGAGSEDEAGGSGVDDPQRDWEFLERADSIIRSSGMRRLAERLAGQRSD